MLLSDSLVYPTTIQACSDAIQQWEIAETAEMKEIVGLYGKTFHFWQVDRGDQIPLGMPELMMSFTKDEQVRCAIPRERFGQNNVEILTNSDAGQVPWDKVKDRDARYHVSTARKAEIRKEIGSAERSEHADSCWKKEGSFQ